MPQSKPTSAPRVWNARRPYPADAVAVDRSGPYGNPFRVGRDGTRNDVIRKYRRWINNKRQRKLRQRIKNELRGKDLVCWCHPLPCHADVILEIANEDD